MAEFGWISAVFRYSAIFSHFQPKFSHFQPFCLKMADFGWKRLNFGWIWLRMAENGWIQPFSEFSHFQPFLPKCTKSGVPSFLAESGQLWLRMAEPEFWMNSQDRPNSGMLHHYLKSKGRWSKTCRIIHNHQGVLLFSWFGWEQFLQKQKTETQKLSSLICHMPKSPHYFFETLLPH